jgi:hypothetical protein
MEQLNFIKFIFFSYPRKIYLQSNNETTAAATIIRKGLGTAILEGELRATLALLYLQPSLTIHHQKERIHQQA